jgi:hypothetical protein
MATQFPKARDPMGTTPREIPRIPATRMPANAVAAFVRSLLVERRPGARPQQATLPVIAILERLHHVGVGALVFRRRLAAEKAK